jgi:hypothetical protein
MMLSNVLKTKKAIEVSMRIIDVFILLRESLVSHVELRLEIEYIKKKVDNHGKNIELVFQYLDELLTKKKIRNREKRLAISCRKGKANNRITNCDTIKGYFFSGL